MGDICLSEQSTTSGLVFYSDNTDVYYSTRQDCLRASIYQVAGHDVLISRHDITFLGGLFGALVAAALLSALLRAIT